jgi:acyl-CoA thioesterase
MTLTELLRSMRRGDGSAHANIGEDWLQGRSLFGGLQAAIAVCAMRTVVPDEFPIRSLQMTFIAPVPAGGIDARAIVLRSGKNTRHVEARLEADGELLAHAIAIFGTGRESIVRLDLPPSPMTKTRGRPFVFQPGLMPNFMQHFSVELIEGAPPFSNSKVDRVVYAIGMIDEGSTTESHLLAVADFVPPVALSWMPKIVAGSSMTWMVEFFDHTFIEQPLQGWRIDAQMVEARDGYTSQSTAIYSPAGNVVALSRQSMVVFA